ncbi:SulP family inorganic anion transporter [Azonexus sp.]|jgi:SulP family sulfate permease|uniref:SulP family inorganic anion transporter n=1 Tax=Azonexus sp. TaxID=1872668 RepID=UPI00283AA088|nr:SulP family inorganic anion transporter [Azonexus sp.]
MPILSRLVPHWLKPYPRADLGADLAAGLIVAILVIPQSMAYALLAGLPPQFGLYASILPAIAYALLGSSMVQVVGPVAVTAIMTYAVLSPLAAPHSPQYIVLAAALALLSGLMLLAGGLLRLGFLSQLLSRPVVSGFISGSAVLIVVSQLKYLFGLSLAGDHSSAIVVDLLSHLDRAPDAAADRAAGHAADGRVRPRCQAWGGRGRYGGHRPAAAEFLSAWVRHGT